MSEFDEAWLEAQATLDDSFAEPTLILPQGAGKYLKAPDPSRPPFPVLGIVTEVPVVPAKTQSGRGPDANRADVTVMQLIVSYQLALFGSAAQQPRQADRIQLPTRAGQPTFDIVSTEPEGVARLICRVVPTAPTAPGLPTGATP